MKYFIYSSILLFIFLFNPGCKKKELIQDVDFRAEMINFVGQISNYAKSTNPDFMIIPQNGESLLTEPEYIDVIDGIGKEDLSYGYMGAGSTTDLDVKGEIVSYLNMAINNGKIVYVTDYVFSESEDVPHFDSKTLAKINDAYLYSIGKGFVPYATVRNLNYLTINPGFEPVEDSIQSPSDIRSFLYYLQPEGISKTNYIQSILQTDFDMVIMDMTYDGLDEFTAADIQQIKAGLNNGKGGYVVAYMSIGEAEDYRYYWNNDWTRSGGGIKKDAPEWLYKENKDWDGNYKVLYWYDDWKTIIYGSSDAYLDKIIAKSFDGVYLDIIDAYEYYEDIMGL